MTRNRNTWNTWAIAVVAAAFTTTIVGGVALATVQPFATAAIRSTLRGPAADLVDRDRPNRLTAALDALVTKGTITQAQEDAIILALKDSAAAPRPKLPIAPLVPGGRNGKAFIGDLRSVTATYLGISEKDLATQLRSGKSVADIAASLHKSTTDLAALLTTQANGRIDQAVAAKRLTAEQATALKSKVATEVATFLQRPFKQH